MDLGPSWPSPQMPTHLWSISTSQALRGWISCVRSFTTSQALREGWIQHMSLEGNISYLLENNEYYLVAVFFMSTDSNLEYMKYCTYTTFILCHFCLPNSISWESWLFKGYLTIVLFFTLFSNALLVGTFILTYWNVALWFQCTTLKLKLPKYLHCDFIKFIDKLMILFNRQSCLDT